MSVPSIGTQLGSYRIEALLGRGGMGVVYRAEDLRLGRSVALKLLASHLTEDARFRSRFLAESRLAASIDHAGIVPIYEAGESDGQLYIAMRYVDGTDLGSLLHREGPMEPQRAIDLVAQLGSALDAAHARGLVHRDVKPSNALIAVEGADEHVYLADFGLTMNMATAGGVTAGDQLVGTVDYLAPECITGEPADGRADIYSLGCVLFEALTGEVPFPRDSEVAAIYSHLEDEPPRPSERRPGVPVGLDAVVARALAKEPERRWQSGAELAAAARAALGPPADTPAHAGGARRRPPRRVVAGAAAVLAALALVVVLLVDRSGGGALAVADADAVAVVDPGKHSLLADIPVGSSPSQVTAGAGALWVANESGGTVSRIDRRTRAVSQTITVGNGPAAVAVGAGGVWVANSLDGTLNWISPATNTVVKTIAAGDSPSGVCVTAGAVWVASTYDRSIVRFDPATERTTTTSLADQPTQLACGGGSLWAISQTSGTVTQLRPGRSRGSVVRRIAVGRGLSGVAWGHGALWVTNTVDGTVSRIDPRSGVRTAVIALGSRSGPSSVVVSGSAVWVGNARAGTVARIDPARNAVAPTLRTGNHPQGLAVVDGALWVSVRATGAQHRGGTLHVLDTKTADGVPPTAALLDPANGYGGWGSLTLTNDGLVAFRRVGGRQSSTLVPDLAESLPAPTDGGRTYTFQVRRGLRYSTGAAVHASDVRRGLERVLRLNGDSALYYTGIRGARRCVVRRAPCDLSSGARVDDAAGTITFRLTAPDQDFLYKLALPSAVAVAPGLGVVARRPVPATGPYMVADLSARAPLRLVRNPRFRPVDGRPDGYPDAITIDCCADGQRAFDAVGQGSADLVAADFGLDPKLHRRVDAIATRYAGQLHSTPTAGTNFAFLNTRTPPFDNVDVRRALNYAVDRSRFVALYGGGRYAQATCQFLPANFPGHRPYCPYTAAAGGGRPWSAPDLVRARRLIARSHTRGMRITVLTGPLSPFKPWAREIKTLLNQLGYRATLRVFPDPDAYFRYIADSRHRAQIGPSGFFPDYPAASGMLQPLRCDAFLAANPTQPNYSEFCDRRADQLATRASRLPADDARADTLWAAVDKRVTDQAATLPLIAPNAITFVSRRVGNYQYSQQSGVLYDQLWVR
ncbi:MAG TPA: ABC transporter substrate-binding protein [Solirubrobacteraceae bacterium]